jgi:DnaJ-class molecular chaperone
MVESQRGLDYWGVLGLEPGADAAALKRAFRDQARRWHPDLNGSDPVAEDRFKQVNEAYAVLSDPRKRRAWEEGPAAGGESGADDPFASGFPDFEAYLDRLFGRVPPEEVPDDPTAYRGNAEPAAARTDPGEGRWRDSSAAAVGRGDVATTPAPPPPPVVAASDEETVLNLSPEQALEGSQVELELADGLMVEVTTPPLAGDGWRLRLAGVTPGGGDHFLQLRVRTEEGLRIDGLRVLYPLELAPADAVLGCQVVVPTLEGPVRLRVPAGSSSGRMLRLRGRGLRDGQRCGDQLVEVRIVVPTDLDEAEQALYRRLQQLAQEREDAGAGPDR